MCVNCSQQVENAYKLKLKCEESDQALRSYLNQSSVSISTNTTNHLPLSDLKELNFNSDIRQNNLDSDILSDSCSDIYNEARSDTVTFNKQDINNATTDNCTNDSNPIPLNKLNIVQNNFRKNKCVSQKRNLVRCVTCYKEFKTRVALNTHKKEHNKDILHICTVCDEQYDEGAKLVDHMLLRHTEKQTHNDLHQKSIQDRLVCNVCNKAYLKASNLTAHMGTHTGIKPYECKTCGKRFTQGRAYACHMRTHTDTAKKPHRCQICNKDFDKETQLQV